MKMTLLDSKTTFTQLGVLTVVLFSTGCSGKQTVSVQSPIDVRDQQNVYVIERTTSTVVGYNVIPIPGSVIMTDGKKDKKEAIGKTAVHISNALRKNGFEVTIGDGKSIPDEINLVVTYHDAWQWDFKMYLKVLTVTFFEKDTKKKIAEGTYIASGGGMHDYPDSEREAPNIIGEILASK